MSETSEEISDQEPEHGGTIQLVGATRENRFSLAQNSPNLFRTKTTISYSIPKASCVMLSIFDYAGRLVAKLVDSERSAGSHTATWYTESATSGIYFYRLEVSPEGTRSAGSFMDVKKMVVMR